MTARVKGDGREEPQAATAPRIKGTVRMRDIAAVVGVSTAAVSKVLGGGPAAERFNEHTAKRIRAAAAHMGYVPNRVARNLRAQRTHEVGVALGAPPPNLQTEPFDGHLLLGLSEAAADCDLSAVVVYPRERGQPAHDLSRYLDGRIDGLIVRCMAPFDVELLQALAAKRMPLVALWRQSVPEGVGYVDIDHYGGMYRAAQHLLDLGHRRIAFCLEHNRQQQHPHFSARYEGYRQALIDAGIAPISEWLVLQPEDLHGLLSGPRPVTAACAFNDTVARKVIAALDTAGVRIPADLSLAGFDNLPGIEHVAGGLTTVDHPIREMGRQAIRCLAALIDGAAVEQCRVVLPTPLVIRQSTACLAGGT